MRLLQPLRVKAIALLWGGLATSAVGDQLGTMAITWIAVDTFGAAAGYLTALAALVTLLAALLVGRWTDGRNERRLMIGADLVRAAALFAVVAAWAVTGRTGGVALTALILTLSICQAVFRPSVQSVMPALAPTAALLPATNALLDATERVARLAGPGLIALAAASLPVAHFLTIDAATFMVSAAAVFLIGHRPTRSRTVDSGLGAAVLQGFRAMRRHRLLGYLLGVAGVGNGCWYAALFLGVPLLLARGGQADGLRSFGTLVACYGITNLTGNLIVGSRTLPRRPEPMIFGGNLLTGGGIMLIGLVSLRPDVPLWWLYLGSAISGIGGPLSDIPRSTLMQTALATEDIGASFRAWMVMANAGILCALVAAPTLFSLVGPAIGTALCGAGSVATAVYGLARWARSR